MSCDKKIKRIMLTQPNYAWFGKRTWKFLPYALGLLNASLKKAAYESWIFEPNFHDLSEQQVRAELRRTHPDVVAISSLSSEYIRETQLFSKIIKEELPQAVVILGGILPTVLLEKIIADPHIDYFVIGEGEYRLPLILDAISAGNNSIMEIDGLAGGRPPQVRPMEKFISDLDAIPFPDYEGIDVSHYMNYTQKYAHSFLPRQLPFAMTITSRGCPYKCIFCAAGTVSGRKVRLRSAENVLQEIDELYAKYKIREIIFLDDHFLVNRQRAVDIMNGLIHRNYGMTWKCVNLSIWSLNQEILRLMRDSGCYQFTVSVESGHPDVVKHLVKKPVNLNKVPGILDFAKHLGFEIAVNFVFGFPGETWEQIRHTCNYAANLNVDLVNFHIATPLPKTELMEMCLREGYLQSEDAHEYGYSKGIIETSEFTPLELQILRAFEWDRINFSTPERKESIAKMEGISMAELETWRRQTRHHLGTTIGWKERYVQKSD